MSKIALACMFRHNPDEDGHTIPASLTRPDPGCEWEVLVDPIIGYMAVLNAGKISWQFIKYEAPDARYPKRDSKRPVYRLGRLSTCRVGHVTCPSCGNSCIYPVWGKVESMPCPTCASRGLEVTYVKETSSEFFSLMGDDIKNALEAEVRSVDLSADDNEFRFPELLVMGRFDPDPDPLIDPALQGMAQSRGLALRSARHTTPDQMFGEPMAGEDTGLLIMPGTTSGTLEYDEAREGWSRTYGVVTWSVKLPWLQELRSRRIPYGGARL